MEPVRIARRERESAKLLKVGMRHDDFHHDPGETTSTVRLDHEDIRVDERDVDA